MLVTFSHAHPLELSFSIVPPSSPCSRLYRTMASQVLAKTLTLGSKAKLADGNLIPRLGLGVYEMSDAEASRAVTWALEAGYRHFDW